MNDITILLSVTPLVLMFAAGMWPVARGGVSPNRNAGIQAAAWITLAISLAAAFLIAWHGPISAEIQLLPGLSLPVYLDALTAIMLVLVSFLGTVVVRYSVACMAGHERKHFFYRWLCLTIASVLGLLISGNLLMFTVAWMATSLSLHQLLTFNAERPGAILAARKKFIVSRLGDLCLLGAMAVCWRIFHSWNFAVIFHMTHAMTASHVYPHEIVLLDMLLAVAACLKSAQFPFHSWLPDTMETPTPVSALMHAGIINAGGFLIIRLSPLLILCPQAMAALALIGGVTAIFGSTVMMAQTSIKRSLAFSTVGQMGFMMLECGLGAFSLAVLHLVAHSLYKAHAFLSSGSTVGRSPGKQQAKHWAPVHGTIMSRSFQVALILIIAATWALNQFGASMTFLPLLAIAIMALTVLFSLIYRESKAYIIAVIGIISVLAISTVYCALDLGISALLASTLPPQTLAAMTALPELPVLLVVMFVAAAWIQMQLCRPPQSDRSRCFYVHTANGFYIGSLANRMVSVLWPLEPERQKLESQSNEFKESLDVSAQI
jgi:NAD(P)H-quinone oxidoreductase subunit 5